LGYKTEENDPWFIFQKTYNIGDVVDATIVSIMPFGAFAEIMPDMDGLIHISQISDKPVSNPASVLKVGDKVTVKITAADVERRRLSLSIRALLEPEVAAEAVEEVVEETLTPATEEAAE
jgi:4-hydroxy-3-methylbut-2-enyl diphosphate reductase